MNTIPLRSLIHTLISIEVNLQTVTVILKTIILSHREKEHSVFGLTGV